MRLEEASPLRQCICALISIAFGLCSVEISIYHGFVRFADGVIKTFDAPGAGTTAPSGGTDPSCINDDGDIVGTFTDSAGVSHGFIRFSDGHFEALEVRTDDGDVELFPVSINSKGEITGLFSDPTNGTGGTFLRKRDGTFIKFQVASYGTFPKSINQKGEITGGYLDSTGTQHGFLRKFGHERPDEDQGSHSVKPD